LQLALTSADEAKGAPTILGFTHNPVGGASLNTIRSSSRLVLSVLGRNVT
jgi:uncharacterized protein